MTTEIIQAPNTGAFFIVENGNNVSPNRAGYTTREAAEVAAARPKTLDRVEVVSVTNGDDELVGRVGTVTNTFGGLFTVRLDPGPYEFTFRASELRKV